MISERSRGRVRITLEVLKEQELTAEQWQEVDKLLSRLDDALEQDNEDALLEAVKSLRNYTGDRIGEIGTSPSIPIPKHTRPIPKHTREHMNLLIHNLAPQEENPPPDEQKDAQEPSNDGE